MKKLLLTIIILLAMTGQGWGADYYSCATASINGSKWNTVAANCGSGDATFGSGGFPATGDNLYANNTTVTIDVDFTIGSGKLSTAAGAGTAGGGFSIAAGRSITASLEGGTTDCLTTTGSGTVTIAAAAITGGSVASADGLACAAQTCVITGAGTITGGGNGTAYGVRKTSGTGNLTITADITGATGAGVYNEYASALTVTGNVTGGTANDAPGIFNGSTGTVTVTGNVSGGASGIGTHGIGCKRLGSGAITVTGNLIYSAGNSPIDGPLTWTPTAPGDGVGHYIKIVGGTDVYAGTAPAGNDASKVLPGYYFTNSTDGTSTVGTASTGGGGGAWGF